MTSNKQAIDACFESQLYIQGKTLWLYKKELTAEDMNYLVTHQGVISTIDFALCYCKIQTLAISQLKNGNWLNLKSLTIDGPYSDMSNEQCKLLAQIQAPQLTDIQLPDHGIKPEGFLALTNASWPRILIIDFKRNSIGDEGCHYLAKSNWNLISINLIYNQIGEYGVKSLLKARWPNLTKLQLSQNKIGNTGCKYLSQAQWKHLKQISLESIGISKTGYMWLSKAYWKSLQLIILGNDLITWEGCRYLSSCSSAKLRDLTIKKISTYHLLKVLDEDLEVQDEGWFYLIKSNWKLTHFSMGDHFFQNPKHIQQICGKSFPTAQLDF